jgi:UDP-N-acetylmuramyl pentapeptide phosphotransferase/UDP-N-acetylglucosamine-1-phosphate transferase
MKFLEAYPPTPITPAEIGGVIVFIGVMVILFLLRKHPVFNVIYNIVVIFLVVLFATLGANFLKKEIKEWWEK